METPSGIGVLGALEEPVVTPLLAPESVPRPADEVEPLPVVLSAASDKFVSEALRSLVQVKKGVGGGAGTSVARLCRTHFTGMGFLPCSAYPLFWSLFPRPDMETTTNSAVLSRFRQGIRDRSFVDVSSTSLEFEQRRKEVWSRGGDRGNPDTRGLTLFLVEYYWCTPPPTLTPADTWNPSPRGLDRSVCSEGPALTTGTSRAVRTCFPSRLQKNGGGAGTTRCHPRPKASLL